MELGGEVHFKRPRELGRSAEGEVDVLAEHLGDVGARDLHALGEVGLGDAQLLHAEKNLSQECRADVIDCSHRGQGSGVRGQEAGVSLRMRTFRILPSSEESSSSGSTSPTKPRSLAISNCVSTSNSDPRA